MEQKSADVLHEEEVAGSADGTEMSSDGIMLNPVSSFPRYNLETKLEWKSGEVLFKDGIHEMLETSNEVNMEASISPEDLTKAGGFGARDDISSFLPVASDSTDFEASIREARNYEEVQGEVSRPGIGWCEESKPPV